MTSSRSSIHDQYMCSARLTRASFLLDMHRLDLQGEFLLRGQGVRDGHTLEIRSGHAPAFIQKQITT